MSHANVEYFFGPLDGRRVLAMTGEDNRPGSFRIVPVKAWRSALDDEPPALETHKYDRAGDSPDRAGVWRYTWSGPLH